MNVCGVKAWKDSDQNVNGGYLILVEFQGFFSYFLDLSLLVKFLQWFALLRNWKKLKSYFYHDKTSISKIFKINLHIVQKLENYIS